MTIVMVIMIMVTTMMMVIIVVKVLIFLERYYLLLTNYLQIISDLHLQGVHKNLFYNIRNTGVCGHSHRQTPLCLGTTFSSSVHGIMYSGSELCFCR